MIYWKIILSTVRKETRYFRKTSYKLRHQKCRKNKFVFNWFVSLKNLNFSRLPIFIALAKAIPERANKIMILDAFEEFGKISSISLLNGWQRRLWGKSDTSEDPPPKMIHTFLALLLRKKIWLTYPSEPSVQFQTF